MNVAGIKWFPSATTVSELELSFTILQMATATRMAITAEVRKVGLLFVFLHGKRIQVNKSSSRIEPFACNSLISSD